MTTSLAALLSLLLLAAPAGAETIAVPEAAVDAIAEACPDCDGVLPCGTPDVQYGRRFPGAAMQGTPARAYLLARAPVREDLLPVLTGHQLDAAVAGLSAAFEGVRLLAIEGDWATVRLLAPDGRPRVTVDPAQHACFRDPGRGLGCCLGDGPAGAGCLPKADPPDMRLDFTDGEETLRLRYPVGKGEVTLRRGGLVYWCLGWAHAGLEAR